MTDVSTVSEDVFVDEEDDVEVLVEPRFKYSRILGHLVKSLDADVASTFALHDKFLAVGFQSGRICFYDHLGNETFHSSARYHKCTVSCISIDKPGNYFISCANDFIVNIFGIGSTEYNQRLSLSYSARVVAIAADFSRPGSNQRFLVGHRNLVLFERGIRAELFAGKRRETVLYKGLERDGVISAVAWEGQLIGFVNETGTRIFDLKLGRSLSLVQPFHSLDAYPLANYPPKLSWVNSSTLVIGWANTICVCAIQAGLRRYSNNGGPSFDLPVKHGQILHKFTISDFFVAGISYTTLDADELYDQQLSPLPNQPASPPNSARNLKTDVKNCDLIVFGIRNNTELNEDSSPNQLSMKINEVETKFSPFSAQLLLLRPVSVHEYVLISEDTIQMRNTDMKYLPRFGMCSLNEDNLFYLMGAREIIEAVPCSMDDRITWLIENELFEDAWERALRSSESLCVNSLLEVGKRLINHLIDLKAYDSAASYLPQICSKHKVEWEFYVNEFERHHQILKLVPVIPTKDPQLEPECYESILLAALYSRPKLFDAIVSNWSADIYRAHSIRDKMFDRIATDNRNRQLKVSDRAGKDSSVKLLSEEDRGYILHGLATLYLKLQDYQNAVKTFLLLGNSEIFGIINQHKLFSYIVKKEEKDKDHGVQSQGQQGYIKQLMEISQTLTIRLLLDNEDLLPHDEVVKLLGNDPKIQMNYLLLLQSRGEGKNYSNRLVRLLAEHKREELLPFLRKNEHYKLDEALEVCRKKDFVNELVYLLGRSGNRVEALDLMMNKLKRIEMAIEFCEENGDIELWQHMISSAINHPDHIACLLRNTASININPLDIIEKIPQSMKIPGLRDCLLQVLRDYEQRIGLLKYSNSIASSDTFEQLKKRLSPDPFIVNYNSQAHHAHELRCAICGAPFSNTTSIPPNVATHNDDIFLRFDGIAIHERCVRPIPT